MSEPLVPKRHEAIFDEIFAAYGGRLYPAPPFFARSLEVDRTALVYWVRRVKTALDVTRFPEIYFDYLSSGSVNAVASETLGYGYIGLTWGAIAVLGDLFFRMLSHPDVLPFIGKSSGEDLDESLKDGISLDATSFQTRRGGDTDPRQNQVWATVPKDPLRCHFARLCGRAATDFLILHELAHIGYGHVRYLKANFDAPFLVELEALTSSTLGQITRQALEMNADAFAASAGLTGFLGYRQKWINDLPELDCLIADEPKAIFVWAFGLGALFSIFSPTFDVNSLTTQSHLPPSIRLEGSVKCGLDVCARAYPKTKDILESGSLNLLHLGHALSCIGHRLEPSLVSDYQAARRDPRLEAHVQGVLRRFKELKPDLKPYSYFDLEKGNPQDEVC